MKVCCSCLLDVEHPVQNITMLKSAILYRLRAISRMTCLTQEADHCLLYLTDTGDITACTATAVPPLVTCACI